MLALDHTMTQNWTTYVYSCLEVCLTNTAISGVSSPLKLASTKIFPCTIVGIALLNIFLKHSKHAG